VLRADLGQPLVSDHHGFRSANVEHKRGVGQAEPLKSITRTPEHDHGR
jgi:hypothetical protein